MCVCPHHSDGPKRQQVVVLLAVAPGVPARIIALLQDVHLSTEVHLLPTHKTANTAHVREMHTAYNTQTDCLLETNLRAALHTKRADPVHAHRANVHALSVDLDHAALEVLLVKYVHLIDIERECSVRLR